MPEFAFVFPGQGSQKLGMLSELASAHPLIERTFEEASGLVGEDLWEIAQRDGGNTLDQTRITQPVLLTASVAVMRLWEALGGAGPSVAAGHSVGEYAALVCAGVLDFADAVRVVHRRGHLMQEAAPEGTGRMAAIVGLDDGRVRAICERAGQGQVVSPANLNSPGQTVIAGHVEAVDRAVALCRDAGAKRALPLKVSVPSHCALMRPAAEKLAAALADVPFSAPRIDVVQNVDGAVCRDPDRIRRHMTEQLHRPVLWMDCVRTIARTGARAVVEIGPGKVLCGLVRRIDPELPCYGSEDQAGLDAAMAAAAA